MSTQNMGVSTVSAPSLHAEAVVARLGELRAMRETIPNFVVPTQPGETRRLIRVAGVPPEFIELTVVAVERDEALAIGVGASMPLVRDRMAFAEAYAPLADEFDAMAQFLRHSIIAARNEAGDAALTIYEVAKRMAKRPKTAALAPHVADMRRALGIQKALANARATRKKAAAEKAEAEKHAAPATPSQPPPKP